MSSPDSRRTGLCVRDLECVRLLGQRRPSVTLQTVPAALKASQPGHETKSALRMVHNASMADWTQLIAPAGVLAGSGLTMVGNWALERVKGANVRKTEARTRSASECEQFLAAVEAEVRGIKEFEEERGVFPVDFYGWTSPATARKHLTALELYGPPQVHEAAVLLVEKLEAWADTGKDHGAYLGARAAFVERFRRLAT